MAKPKAGSSSSTKFLLTRKKFPVNTENQETNMTGLKRTTGVKDVNLP
jgi:hypothetical protein